LTYGYDLYGDLVAILLAHKYGFLNLKLGGGGSVALSQHFEWCLIDFDLPKQYASGKKKYWFT